MIKDLKIKNFKSVKESETHFLPVTVFVGANGSGKSNIIKILQFISSIPQNGLELTVNTFGGINALLPKGLSSLEAKNAKIEFDYSINIGAPIEELQKYGPFLVRHKFGLSNRKSGMLRLDYEEVIFEMMSLRQR